jgi:hypothetical protein
LNSNLNKDFLQILSQLENKTIEEHYEKGLPPNSMPDDTISLFFLKNPKQNLVYHQFQQ